MQSLTFRRAECFLLIFYRFRWSIPCEYMPFDHARLCGHYLCLLVALLGGAMLNIVPGWVLRVS